MNLPLVCIAKALRTVGFGAVSVVFALYLIERGFNTTEVGALFSLTLLEDALLTTVVSVFANRLGMRAVLLLSSLLILIGGFALAFAQAPWVIALAVVFGIVSPAGYEGGPFAPIEQAIISQSVRVERLTAAYSWYNLVGFGGAALGALLAGGLVALMKGQPAVQAYQAIFILNALSSFILATIYIFLDTSVLSGDQRRRPTNFMVGGLLKNAKQSWRDVLFGHSQTQTYVRQLAGLQAIDAFGGGFVVQSLLTCWFYQRYHVDATFIGPVFFGCNIIAALSFIVAPYVVRRIGLLNAMVFTHLPCSLALCLMPFLPTAGWAASLLLLRSVFSSMDIPARQAYTMLIVPADERPAAAGVTTSARAVAQGVAPALTGFLMNNAVTGLPLVLAGVFKSVYDVSLYFAFKSVPFHNEALDRVPLLDKPTDELELREPERVR